MRTACSRFYNQQINKRNDFRNTGRKYHKTVDDPKDPMLKDIFHY